MTTMAVAVHDEGAMRTGQEQKAQAMDPALYNGNTKKGPRDIISISWTIGNCKSFFLFISFFVINKVFRY